MPKTHLDHVRIRFPLAGNVVSGETMWGKPNGDGTYVIDNLPFFAYGVTMEDVVSAVEVDGILTAQRVVRRGPYDPYRFVVESNDETIIRSVLEDLKRMGFKVERARLGFYAGAIERGKREQVLDQLDAYQGASLTYELALSAADDQFSSPDDGDEESEAVPPKKRQH